MFTNNRPFGRILGTWTDLTQPVARRVYLTHGLSLAAVKYLGDVLLVYAASGVLWTPTRYVHGLPSLLPSQSPSTTWWLALALAVWMLPFLAIGTTLSLRRAIDAGRSPWLSILFLVPFVNYALIATLAALPSRRHDHEPAVDAFAPENTPRAAAFAVVAGVLVAVLAVHLGVTRPQSYGGWLFVLTPFAMGACTAFSTTADVARPSARDSARW